MIRKFLAVTAMTVVALGLSQVVSAQHHDGCCEDDCGGPKICVPKTETKKVAKPYYDCKCVQFCLPPKCQHGGGHRHGCDDCDQCAECFAPRTKKVLIKKIKIEEECVTSCDLQDGCADECGRRHRLLHRRRDAGCCEGAIIIQEGSPASQGAEQIAPPKNLQ